LALFITANFANAQDTLYVYKAGAQIYKQAVTGVDSITFTNTKKTIPSFLQIGPTANYQNVILRSSGSYSASADLDVYEFANLGSVFANTNFNTQIGVLNSAELLGENFAGEIFRATDHNGIYKYSASKWSSNGLSGYGTGGSNWTKLNNGRIIISKKGYLRNIYYSDDDGSHWTSVGLGDIDWYNIIKTNSGSIFAVSSNGGTGTKGLIRSTNNGTNWTYLNTNVPLNGATSFAADYSNNLYVISTNFSIYKSTDDGNTWSFFNTTPNSEICYQFLFTQNKVYLISYNGTSSKLYYSDLLTINWKDISSQFPTATSFNLLMRIKS